MTGSGATAFLFPPAEMVVRAFLLAQFDSLNLTVCTETPNNLNQVLPLVKIQQAGGIPDWWADEAHIDVECYQPTSAQGAALAKQIQFGFQFQLRNNPVAVTTPSGPVTVVVSQVQVMTAPSWRPYDDISLRRYGAMYALRARPSVATPI